MPPFYRFAEITNQWGMDPLVGYSCGLGRYTYTGLLGRDDDRYLRAFRGYWVYASIDDVALEIPGP
jgi:hypothetical protein